METINLKFGFAPYSLLCGVISQGPTAQYLILFAFIHGLALLACLDCSFLPTHCGLGVVLRNSRDMGNWTGEIHVKKEGWV